MKFLTTMFLALFALAVLPTGSAQAAPEIGQPAPAFTAVDTNGNTHSLEDFLGKTVVLEWTNHDCPYVRKFYEVGAMQALQQEVTANEDMVWLVVNTSAEGQQGHFTAEQANEWMEQQGFASTAYLLDPEGEIGMAYEAKTTPQMYIIDAEGTLVYNGAIDDQPSANPATLEGATNYVRAALANIAAGEPVETALTNPYGCSVKYKNM